MQPSPNYYGYGVGFGGGGGVGGSENNLPPGLILVQGANGVRYLASSSDAAALSSMARSPNRSCGSRPCVRFYAIVFATFLLITGLNDLTLGKTGSWVVVKRFTSLNETVSLKTTETRFLLPSGVQWRDCIAYQGATYSPIVCEANTTRPPTDLRTWGVDETTISQNTTRGIGGTIALLIIATLAAILSACCGIYSAIGMAAPPPSSSSSETTTTTTTTASVTQTPLRFATSLVTSCTELCRTRCPVSIAEAVSPSKLPRVAARTLILSQIAAFASCVLAYASVAGYVTIVNAGNSALGVTGPVGSDASVGVKIGGGADLVYFTAFLSFTAGIVLACAGCCGPFQTLGCAGGRRDNDLAPLAATMPQPYMPTYIGGSGGGGSGGSGSVNGSLPPYMMAMTAPPGFYSGGMPMGGGGGGGGNTAGSSLYGGLASGGGGGIEREFGDATKPTMATLPTNNMTMSFSSSNTRASLPIASFAPEYLAASSSPTSRVMGASRVAMPAVSSPLTGTAPGIQAPISQPVASPQQATQDPTSTSEQQQQQQQQQQNNPFHS